MRRLIMVCVAAVCVAGCGSTAKPAAGPTHPSWPTPTATSTSTSAPPAEAVPYVTLQPLEDAAGLSECAPMPLHPGARAEDACADSLNVWLFGSVTQLAAFQRQQVPGPDQPKWLYGPNWAIEGDARQVARLQAKVGGTVTG